MRQTLLMMGKTCRRWGVLSLLVVLAGMLSACAMLADPSAAQETQVLQTTTGQPQPAPSPTPLVTAVPTVEPLVLPTPMPPLATPTPSTVWLTGELRVYPGPGHFVGDVLSIEVEIENGWLLASLEDVMLSIDGEVLEITPFIAPSPLREDVLVFRWAWDTAETGAGFYTLAVDAPPQDGSEPLHVEYVVHVGEARYGPSREGMANWGVSRSDCCFVYYVMGTAADRDLDQLEAELDAAVTHVEETLGLSLEEHLLPVVFIDNIWGNGAFVTGELVISYVDRMYTGLDLPTVLRHEATHWAARDIGTSRTPTLLSEGLATWVAGGHFGQEPIPQRAAALLALDTFVPLTQLTEDFRAYQHESSYLEAAGLVAYLVETYGLENFINFYGFEAAEGVTGVAWMESALSGVYDISLLTLERDYTSWLRTFDPGEQVTDLRLTVDLHEAVRRYQELYAPYQESLPSVQDAITAGQVAEFMREPADVVNITFEVVLMAAFDALAAGDYERAELYIQTVNDTLADSSFMREPFASVYSIVRQVGAQGYEVQAIDLNEGSATVFAIAGVNWPELEILSFERTESGWALAE